MQTAAAPLTGRLRVVVVEDDEAIRLALKQSLIDTFGHEVIGEANTGPQMIELVERLEPDVVLFDIHLPGLDGLTALKQINEKKSVAAVAITADRDVALVRRASEEQVLGFLVKPFEHYQLGPALELARARFEELQELNSENIKLQQTLENRKLVERAKGVLMKRHRWGEAEAFRRLQRAAMNRRTTMAELAKKVIEGVEVEL
jgi:AmiR/NasT family two-component response regulator